MKAMIRRKNKQNSLNQTNKGKAAFISITDNNTERFKYNFRLRLSKYSNDKIIALMNTCKKIKGVVQLKLDKFDFKAAGSSTTMWLINAFIEGFIVNFAVWGLLGWRFNFVTILAWGFAVKQTLDLYWRLKINGKLTKLPERN